MFQKPRVFQQTRLKKGTCLNFIDKNCIIILIIFVFKAKKRKEKATVESE